MSDGRSGEVGGGVAAVTPRPYVDEPTRATGQLWWTGRAADWASVSAIAAFDLDAVAAGGAFLAKYLQSERVVLGAEAELGYAWAALAAPAAVRLVDDWWLYTAPRVSNWGGPSRFELSAVLKVLAVGIPVGANIPVCCGFVVRPEVQVSWVDFKYYNRRIHYGVAAAFQW
jgi:hypothetical protein